MRTLDERQFHLTMSVLVVGSLLLERQADHLVTGWRMPEVGLVTVTLGLCWVALFAAHRVRNLSLRIEVLADRLERTEKRALALEDDARARRGLPMR
jgi:hypothetical protein